jgi:7-cyano-7-deazaguanine synthase
MNDEKIVILFSGGADSVLLLEIAKRMNLRPFCLMINYGQAHVEELVFAQKYLTEQNIRYQVVAITGLNVDSGLTGDGEKGRYEGASIYYVPGRNTIFLSLAFSIAESRGISEVWYGPDFSDRVGLFPDCYQEYVVKMNEVFKVAGSKLITIYAPLLGLTKEMVLKMLDSFGVDRSKLFSGYGAFT